MPEETYQFLDFYDSTVFFFRSVGSKGVIPKLVVYSPMEGNRWSLSFGDFLLEGTDVKVVSGNNDLRKVINTVIKTIGIFLRRYPEREIYFKPVDGRRKLIFNYFIRAKWQNWGHVEVIGKRDEQEELYQPEWLYDGFIIRNKW